MKMTDALLGEHGVFYAVFDYLEEHLVEVRTADEVRRLAAMLAAALIPHAKLENEVLFPPLEGQMGAGGPIAVMRQEHAEIEGVLNGLGDSEDADELKGRVLRAIRAAREHFLKEETILFPIAEDHVGPGALRTLGRTWAAKRGVTLG